ncbi:hypothetical protein SY88_12320 [Clostridiales bacterium PH28_bin88]|nr:hypothetical protein SY88_12320 [Clostridiales bacterium PH28_bin88]
MKSRTADNISAVVFLLIFIAFAVMSTQYGPRARLVPLPVAGVSAVMVLIQLILQNVKGGSLNLSVDAGKLFKAQNPLEKEAKKGFAGEQQPSSIKARDGKEWGAFSVVLTFWVMIMLFGLDLATLLFVTLYFRVVNKERWIRSLIWGTGTWAAIYLLFTGILRIQLYKGFLFGLF